MQVTKLLLTYYGAEISSTIDWTVTHIIMDLDDLSRFKTIRGMMRQVLEKKPQCGIHLISKEWVEESVQLREDLDPLEFYVLRRQVKPSLGSSRSPTPFQYL